MKFSSSGSSREHDHVKSTGVWYGDAILRFLSSCSFSIFSNSAHCLRTSRYALANLPSSWSRGLSRPLALVLLHLQECRRRQKSGSPTARKNAGCRRARCSALHTDSRSRSFHYGTKRCRAHVQEAHTFCRSDPSWEWLQRASQAGTASQASASRLRSALASVPDTGLFSAPLLPAASARAGAGAPPVCHVQAIDERSVFRHRQRSWRAIAVRL